MGIKMRTAVFKVKSVKAVTMKLNLPPDPRQFETVPNSSNFTNNTSKSHTSQ